MKTDSLAPNTVLLEAISLVGRDICAQETKALPWCNVKNYVIWNVMRTRRSRLCLGCLIPTCTTGPQILTKNPY